ncbi:MAG: hypothetical protein L3K03_05590 [Thermoplasmata archaeon]|nr:hypothetical protein [Thermoplasmata archaeon]
MSTSTRISLTILTIGFGVEGAAAAYALLTQGSFLPGTTILFLFPAVITLLGLLFILIGRHEWDDIHRARVRQAHVIFGLSVFAAILATIELAVLAYDPTLGTPGWAQLVFGTACGAFLFGTFVTYAQLVFHLVRRPSKAALVASIVWALIVSAFVGQALAGALPQILALIGARSFSIGSLIAPVDYLASFLCVSYFLLLLAYLDAHLTVAQGRTRAPPPAPPEPKPPSVSTG